MSDVLSFLFPNPVVQAIAAVAAAFVTHVVPVLVRKARAALAAAKSTP